MSATVDHREPTATETTAERVARTRLPHLPGLDGLRGLAVIGVLLFHGGFTWARGGFLGVSTFFTLSGFLITNLLVREFDATRAISLGRFWTRRFRRLLPAAVVTIALVGLVWWRVGSAAQLGHLRGDMLASLAYVANWRFLTAGTSYADLFSAPSPLQHFWSLAIEEQFYLLFPPIVLVTLRIGGRRLLTGLLVVATVASVALEVGLGDNVDRVYYGTDTRAAELLLGALLAVWWSGRRRPELRHATAAAPPGTSAGLPTALADGAGLVALAGVLWAWHAVSQTSSRLAHGGFPVYALATTAIIYAATRPGLVARLLSWTPLRAAGLVSYGLYLYHWPVFLLVDTERTGWSTGPLFAVRMAITIALAVASYFLLEMPIRRGTMIRTGRALLSAGVAAAVVVAGCAVVVTLDPPASRIPYADADIGDLRTRVVDRDPSLPPVSAPAEGRVAERVFLIGDSGMMDAQPSLTAAFQAQGASKVIQGAGPGLGLSQDIPWRDNWRSTIEQDDPDLVVVMLGGWDLKFIEANGIDAYVPLVREAVDLLTSRGARVIWLPVLPGGQADASPVDDLYAQLPDLYPGAVADPSIADALAGPDGGYPRAYTAADGSDVLLRKTDGWHLCPAGAERVAAAIVERAHDLGWAARPQVPWTDGDWRASNVFDDPPGVCSPS